MFEKGAGPTPAGAASHRSLPVVPVLHDDVPERCRLHAPRRHGAGRNRGEGQPLAKDRLMRRLLAYVVPHPDRFRVALKLAPLARPLVPLLRRFGLQGGGGHAGDGAGRAAAAGPVRWTRHGRDAGRAAGTRDPFDGLRADRCCVPTSTMPPSGCWRGAASTWSCRPARAAAARWCITWAKSTRRCDQARRNIDAWMKEIAKEPVDAIIINASGCGTTVKDYGHMLTARSGLCGEGRRRFRT